MNRCGERDKFDQQCALGDGHNGRHSLTPEHRCHARGCTVATKPEMLMCRRHWFMVPKPLRDRVWATYRPGQCDDKDPSAAWLDAADAAIAAVTASEAAHDLEPARPR